MKMKQILPLLALALIAPAAFGAVLVFLDKTAAYTSPLKTLGAEPDTPRMQAIADLIEARREKEEAARRRAELLENLTTEKMVGLGKEIVHGRGLCFNCHSIGAEGGGTQGPNLEGVGSRAGDRIEGFDTTQYLAQSLFEPEAYVVEGFAPSMTPANQPPMSLSDDEILWVVSYLQSLGGEVQVEPTTELSYSGKP